MILDSCRDEPLRQHAGARRPLQRPQRDPRRLQRADRADQLAPRLLDLARGRSPTTAPAATAPSPRRWWRRRRAWHRTLPVGQIFEQVRRAVYAGTEGQQVPWESSTLVEPRLGSTSGLGDPGETGGRRRGGRAEPAGLSLGRGGAGGGGSGRLRGGRGAEPGRAAGGRSADRGRACTPRSASRGMWPRCRSPGRPCARPARAAARARWRAAGDADAGDGWTARGLGDGLTFVGKRHGAGAGRDGARSGARRGAFSVAVDGVEHRGVQLTLEADPCERGGGRPSRPRGHGAGPAIPTRSRPMPPWPPVGGGGGGLRNAGTASSTTS